MSIVNTKLTQREVRQLAQDLYQLTREQATEFAMEYCYHGVSESEALHRATTREKSK